LNKLRADFEVLFKVLEHKYAELADKIEQSFRESVQEAKVNAKGFEAVQTRLNYLHAVNPQKDIDLVQINYLSADLLKLLDKDINFERTAQSTELSESAFVNDPIQKVESLMAEYDFKDVSSRQLSQLRQCFADSNILKGKRINNEVYLILGQIH